MSCISQARDKANRATGWVAHNFDIVAMNQGLVFTLHWLNRDVSRGIGIYVIWQNNKNGRTFPLSHKYLSGLDYGYIVYAFPPTVIKLQRYSLGGVDI